MLTPLELDVLCAFEAEFGAASFPSFDQIEGIGRENTGAGRYTDLSCDVLVQHESPFILSAVIQMEGLNHGLGALVFFTDGKLDCLELHLFGDDGWDGVERPWKIVPLDEIYA